MNFDLLFDKAKSKGIEDLQVYMDSDTGLSITVVKGVIDEYKIFSQSKLSVKGIYDSKMGTVSTEVINDDVIDFLVASIIASAKTINSEDEVFIYEGDKEYKEIKGLYNPELAKIDVKVKIDNCKLLEQKIMAIDERITFAQVNYSESSNNIAIKNTKGLDLEKESNNVFMYAQIMATDGKDQRMIFEYVMTNDYSDIDLDDLAQKGVAKAVALLGAKPCKSGEYEILLSNDASSDLLNSHFSMFYAESVQRDVSLLKGKIGEEIGSNKVTLVDDPFMQKSSRSGAFDDEGVATSYKEIIKDGILTGYLYNLKTAKKDNCKSTGNATNRGISASNFYILPGDSSYDDVVKSMKKGIIITDIQGQHAGTSPISGDFSLQAAGFLVEEGKIVRPVALITIAGNYLELLKDVTHVCNDLKMNYAYSGSPSLKIKSLVVSGT